MKLSIVVPVFNEGKTVKFVLQKLLSLKLPLKLPLNFPLLPLFPLTLLNTFLLYANLILMIRIY